jgi:putative transposase
MKKQKSYKFRLYPNLEQKILFEKTFGCSRFIWNQMLADKKAHYEKTGEFLKNTPAQYKEEFPWLKEVDSLALCNVQLNLNKAYKSFFQSVSVSQSSNLRRLLSFIRQIIRKG